MSVVMSLLLFVGGFTSKEVSQNRTQTGKASFYAPKFTGRRTYYGERVSAQAFEGAHRQLPLNTLVEVTNNRNHRSVIVRINDRGPFAKGRVIDLTYAAAKAIGMVGAGVANVTLRVIGRKKRATPASAASVFSRGTQPLPLSE